MHCDAEHRLHESASSGCQVAHRGKGQLEPPAMALWLSLCSCQQMWSDTHLSIWRSTCCRCCRCSASASGVMLAASASRRTCACSRASFAAVALFFTCCRAKRHRESVELESATLAASASRRACACSRGYCTAVALFFTCCVAQGCSKRTYKCSADCVNTTMSSPAHMHGQQLSGHKLSLRV